MGPLSLFNLWDVFPDSALLLLSPPVYALGNPFRLA